MRKQLITVGLIAALLIYLGTVIFMNRQLIKQQNTSIQNINTLTQAIQHYKLKDSSNVAIYKVLQLDLKAVKQTMPEIINQLQTLKIKSSRTQTIIQTVTESSKEISVPVHDTFYVYQGDTSRFKEFTYFDKFYKVDGRVFNKKAELNILSRDTVFTAIYKGKRLKPWFWFFSPRQIEVKQRNANPANIVTYSRAIQIK